MVSGERVCDHIEGHAHVVTPARLEWRRLRVSFSMREVQESPSDQGGGPVRKDVAESHAGERLGSIDFQIEHDLWVSENLAGPSERPKVERERHRVVGPLVTREVGRLPFGDPGSGLRPGRLDGTYRPRT